MNSGQAYPAHGLGNAGPPQAMVVADGICRTFGSGHTAVHALRGVSFTVDRGQLVALRGRSGSGKTTLLNIIGGLDDPTAGRVWVDGREVNQMTERKRLALRRDRVAFVFQAFGLVPMLSAAENVGIPLRIEGLRRTGEFTLMRARGAALYQLGWLVLRASVIVAAVTGAAAVFLAISLTPGDADAVGWWLAGLTTAVALAGPVLISVVPQRVAAPVAERPGRRAGGRNRAVRRIVVETVLVAVVAGGLVVLRDQGLSSGSSGLYTSAAPVLIAIGVAVVILRCYPPIARELARIAGLSRGVVAFVGLARPPAPRPAPSCRRSRWCWCWPWWRSRT